jgi:thioredoxin-like negative regulator of GroEL
LTPVLEEKAIEADGKFKLVKVNIDLLPEIASGLNVRSIPAVFLVKDGNVMDTFTGLPSDERIQDFINTAKLLEQLSHDEKTIDQVIFAAEDHIKSEDYYSASEIFRQAMVTANFTEEQH